MPSMQKNRGVTVLAQQTSTLSITMLNTMLCNGENRDYVKLKKSRGGPYYLVTVKALSVPERTYVKKRALSKLTGWWAFFQDDIFLGVVEEHGFRFPTLTPSETFYTMTFSDAKHRLYEVSVCPIYTENATVDKRDVIRVFITPPERPYTSEEKLADPYYPSDIVNIQMCDILYKGAARGNSLSRAVELADDYERLVTRVPKSSSEVVEVPQYWDLAFASNAAKETSCGDRSIPQVLGKLWFLQESAQRPVQYSLIQLTALSYVGCIQNVAGFNVFFQVNADMSLMSLLTYFSHVPAQVTPHDRMLSSGPPSVAQVPIAQKLSKGLLRVEIGYLSILLDSNKSTLEMLQNGGNPEKKNIDIIPLWQRVVSYQSSRWVRLWNAMKDQDRQRQIQNVQAVLGICAQASSRSSLSLSFLSQSKIADAVIEVQYGLMLSAIKCIPSNTLATAIDSLVSHSGAVDFDMSTTAALTQKLLPKYAETWLDNGARMFVPVVFTKFSDLFHAAATFLETLPTGLREQMFGPDHEAQHAEASRRWLARNEVVEKVEVPSSWSLPGKKNKKKLPRDRFALWLVHSYADTRSFSDAAKKTAVALVEKGVVT